MSQNKSMEDPHRSQTPNVLASNTNNLSTNEVQAKYATSSDPARQFPGHINPHIRARLRITISKQWQIQQQTLEDPKQSHQEIKHRSPQ